MSDPTRDEPAPRPRPQYGEYAPPGYVPPNQHLSAMPPPTPAQTSARRAVPSWDRGLTVGLLVVGLFGALVGWLIGSTLGVSLGPALEEYGIEPGAMPAWLDAAGTAVAVTHALLYVVAVALSVLLIRAGRPAFWAPLAAGIIAAIVFWSVLSAAAAPYADQLQP